MRSERRRRFLRLAGGATLYATGASRGDDHPDTHTSGYTEMKTRGYTGWPFRSGAYEHIVYVKGEGPNVIVMHELPGFTAQTVNFLDRLVDAGFQVHAPLLFGAPLRDHSTLNFARLCISKEFGHLKANRSAPVCDWLRALARSISEQHADAKVGVIGMCLTGAFVIPMVIEPGVGAGVISQPAIPVSLIYAKTGHGEGAWMQEMNVSDQDLHTAAQRCARDRVPIIAQRFENDRLSTAQRVDRIATAFGSNATLYEYANPFCDKPDPADCNAHPHALLTFEYDDAPHRDDDPTRIALAQVVAFFKEHLA